MRFRVCERAQQKIHRIRAPFACKTTDCTCLWRYSDHLKLQSSGCSKHMLQLGMHACRLRLSQAVHLFFISVRSWCLLAWSFQFLSRSMVNNGPSQRYTTMMSQICRLPEASGRQTLASLEHKLCSTSTSETAAFTPSNKFCFSKFFLIRLRDTRWALDTGR